MKSWLEVYEQKLDNHILWRLKGRFLYSESLCDQYGKISQVKKGHFQIIISFTSKNSIGRVSINPYMTDKVSKIQRSEAT